MAKSIETINKEAEGSAKRIEQLNETGELLASEKLAVERTIADIEGLDIAEEDRADALRHLEREKVEKMKEYESVDRDRARELEVLKEAKESLLNSKKEYEKAMALLKSLEGDTEGVNTEAATGEIGAKIGRVEEVTEAVEESIVSAESEGEKQKRKIRGLH